MNWIDRLVAQAGALINSALYLSMVFVAGLVTGNKAAYCLAAIAAGMSFLCHVSHFTLKYQLPAVIFMGVSIAVGVIAGLALLF